MAIVSAAILTDNLKKAKSLAKRFKKADYIQFDVINDTFVPGKTLWADEIASLKIKHPLEIHLMIEKPERYLSEFLKCNPKRIIFHIETTKNILSIIKRLRKENVEVGIALNPETNIKKIMPYLIKSDLILVMTVHPGKQNQAFLLNQLSKIQQIRKLSAIDIGVDGGINKKTAKLVVKAGATTITSGSYLAKRSSAIGLFKKL